MDNSQNTINENKHSKAKLRRKRYEDTTLNKPCTVRANPNKHDAIKLFAKYNHCNKCQHTIKNLQALQNGLYKQINGPVKWGDRFTNRDQIVCLFTLALTLTTLLAIDVAKSITL